MAQYKMLPLLYNNKIGSLARYILTQPIFSYTAGWYCDTHISTIHIKPFIKLYNIDMHEALLPVSEYKTFNDFFTRKLKAEVRPIDTHPLALISPADGTVFVKENIHIKDEFPIKGRSFDLGLCLQNAKLAAEFEGGTLILIRLAPWDYHRFHFPCDALVSAPEKINGRYESVHPLVYKSIQPLEHNERTLIKLKSPLFGDILYIPVGALFVGSIITTYTPTESYAKGDELGYFAFGGSTIILVFKKNAIQLDHKLLDNSRSDLETPIKMGQPIGFHTSFNTSKKNAPHNREA